jgi:transposase InsO family protein
LTDIGASTPSARRSTVSTKPRSFAGRGQALEAVELATLTWVDWFNHRRLLEPIGFVPPAEAEAAFYAKLENTAAAA